MTRYVAIGDSFTEGLGDTMPDGTQRGWADLVAAGLAIGEKQTIQYANLAIRGRLLEPIVTEQLDAALALDPAPTLLSLNGGGNDMMRPGSDMSQLAGLTEKALRRCADAGVRVLLLSGAEPSDRLPFGSMKRGRARRPPAVRRHEAPRGGAPPRGDQAVRGPLRPHLRRRLPRPGDPPRR